MNDDQTSQPLTGYELDNIEGRWQRYVALRDADSMETSVHDVPDLLAEVDRLRSQVRNYHKSADAHVAKFDRQHNRLMEAKKHVTAARDLHEPARSSAWNYIYCASGCGAGPMNGPDPWPCNTAKALGMNLDQSVERQAAHGE